MWGWSVVVDEWVGGLEVRKVDMGKLWVFGFV